jgi:hypothetical protein
MKGIIECKQTSTLQFTIKIANGVNLTVDDISKGLATGKYAMVNARGNICDVVEFDHDLFLKDGLTVVATSELHDEFDTAYTDYNVVK